MRLFAIVTLALVSGLVLGFFIRHFSQSTPSEPQPLLSFKEKVQSLTENEIREYYQLKEDAYRYRQADELLGKVVLLFLYDLGIKISPDLKEKIIAQIQEPQKQDALGLIPSGLNDEQMPSATTHSQSNEAVKQWLENESIRHTLKDESEVGSFLDRVAIKDFSESLKKTKTFSNRTNQLHLIQGSFSGSAQVLKNEKASKWDLEMAVRGEFSSGKFQGHLQVKMAENGKVFSNSNGNGILRDIKEFESQSDAIIIRASPRTYFQLYYLKSQDSFVGNVYSSEDESENLERVGQLYLRRTK